MQKPKPQYSLEFVLHPSRDTKYVHFDQADSNPFQPDPVGVPRVNAWWLAEAALASYWKGPDAKAIFERAGCHVSYLEHNATECYVAWQQDWLLVTFRGTEPEQWEDVLSDVKVELVPWQVGKVHKGFKDALDEIWPMLEAALDELSPTRKVWFCGHSLGAALATLAADLYPGTRGVCNFGSPRVGNRSFAEVFSAKFPNASLRYVNDHDVVTHVPPPVFGYTHIDGRRVIAPDGTISSGQPGIDHFFTELIGQPEHVLEVIDGLAGGQLSLAPTFLLDHMPKAYAIGIWNDYDANG